MKKSEYEFWCTVNKQSLATITVVEQTLDAIKAQRQIIQEYRKKFSHSSLTFSDDIDRIARVLNECREQVNLEIKLQMHDSLNYDKQVINRLHRIITGCALCIQDGIEKNYDSWYDWQNIARKVLNNNAPEVARNLDRYEDVIKYVNAANSDGKEVAR